MEKEGKSQILPILLPFHYNAVDTDASVFCITVHAFHTVVADLVRIQIAAVAFSTADAFPVIQNTLTMYSHETEPPLFRLYIVRERKVKLEPY